MENSLENTEFFSILKRKQSLFINQIVEVFNYATSVLPKINRVFSNYTGHGIEHSINVMEYMYNLISDATLLSELEITCLIYVALLHDIGMVVNEDEILKIKNDDLNIVDRKYSLVYKKYNEENISLQECIRPIHGIRSKKHIDKQMPDDWFNVPNYTSISFKEEVENICVAHNENFEWITANLSNDTVKGSYQLNSQFIALLLRIADYLDIDESRAPLYLYKYLNPKDFGDMEWQQHFVIENRNKIVFNEKTGNKRVEFYGTSNNPSIHRKLLKYFDNVNLELKNAVNLSETFQNQQYTLQLKTNIENKMRTKGFNFSDFKLTLDFNAVTKLLMGEHIYGNKKYGLRELIQNSMDACKVMLEESYGKDEFLYILYQPFINIILDKDRKQVSIFDNGRGMSLDILKNYFLNVGVSYYVSDEYLLRGNNYTPIGNYGIGFLACFMLSDSVIVNTKYYGESKLNKIEFENNSEYTCLTYEENPRPQGTEIILNYDQFFNIFDNNSTKVQSFIESNFLDCSIPINIISVENGKSETSKINLKTASEADTNNIVLNKYLKDIEGYIETNYKGIKFLENLEDINGYNSFIYHDESNSLSDEKGTVGIGIKDFINCGEIKFLNIPIIDEQDAENFNKAYEVLEEFDGALDKINGYNMVNIVCEDISLYNGKEVINHTNEIVGYYSYDLFCNDFSHDRSTPTYAFLITQKVVQNEGKIVLAYSADKFIGGNFLYNTGDKVYIKNVLISEVKLKIPFIVDGLQLKKAVFNIKNKCFVPNVSRNNISETLKQDLSYAIGKALHLWILENGKLSAEKKELIRNFIKECYPEDNYCLNDL